MESEPFLAFGLVVVALGECELLRDQLAVRLLPKAFKKKRQGGRDEFADAIINTSRGCGYRLSSVMR